MAEIKIMLPQVFVDRLVKFVGPGELERVLKSYKTSHPVTFRVNTFKSSPSIIRNSLFEKNFKLENVLWWKDAFILKNRTLRDLQETEEYKLGLIYVQNLSSMVPALVLDPRAGEKVLDLCAAPGSKTTQIAALMGNRGEIVANDSSRVRLYKLEHNIKQQGVDIVKMTNKRGETLWQDYFEYFDKVLLDAPCSGEGRFIAGRQDTYKDWSLKKVKELSRLQKWLLRSAVSSVRKGGTVVYSTCTLSSEENEEVIDWILKKEKGRIILEKFSINNLQFSNAISDWDKRQYNPEVGRCVRIMPSDMMEGFFVAKLLKRQ